MQKNFAEYKAQEKSKEEEKEAHKQKIEAMMVSPFQNLDLDEQEQRAQELEILFGHIKNSVKRLQMKVGEKLSLNQMFGECL